MIRRWVAKAVSGLIFLSWGWSGRAQSAGGGSADPGAAQPAPRPRLISQLTDQWMARQYPQLLAPAPSQSGAAGGAAGGVSPSPAAGETAPIPGSFESYLPDAMRRLVERYNIQASFNGNFLANFWDARRLDEHDFKNMLLGEMEFQLGAQFTETIRGDFVYSISRDRNSYHGNFEEAYISFLELPFDFQARIGKIKADFGKINAIHSHAWPWLDAPPALMNTFGEEGLSGTGISVSHLVPNPWDVYSELIYQLIEVSPGRELGRQSAAGPAHVMHWKNLFDLTNDSTLEVGLSGALLSQQRGGKATAEGLDLTYKWRPEREGLYKSFIWMNELYTMQNDAERNTHKDLWGFYTSPEYQFARRWSAGVRVDFSQPPDQHAQEWAVAPFITFKQTERLLYRLEFNHIDHDPEHGGRTSNDIRLQFNITLGSHPPHSY